MSKHYTSLSALIEWLKTKNPAETYDYSDNSVCLHGQYFEHLGIKFNTIGMRHYWLEDGRPREFSRPFRETAIIKPHTFGAALARAQTYATEER